MSCCYSYLDKMEDELRKELAASNKTDKEKEEELKAFAQFRHMRERQLYG
jgi:ribonuclease D